MWKVYGLLAADFSVFSLKEFWKCHVLAVQAEVLLGIITEFCCAVKWCFFRLRF